MKPSLKKKTSVKFKGFSFTFYPTVFNLRYSVSSRVFASYVSSLDLSGKKILDMGCGSGVVSIFAAPKGAVCTAVDINPMAVKSAAENAERNGFGDKIKAYEGDLFNPTLILPKGEEINVPSPPGRESPPQAGWVGYNSFDIIFFNPPYYKGTPANDFERAFKGGENYEVITRFFKEAPKYLSVNGYICMIISSDMGLEEFLKIARSYSYKTEIVTKVNKLFETFYIIKLL